MDFLSDSRMVRRRYAFRIEQLIALLIILIMVFAFPLYSLASKTTGLTKVKHYVLLAKPEGHNWQQLQQQMAPEINDLASWQQKIGWQYDLQLNDWLLLPDVNATTHLYPAVDLVQIKASDNLQDFAWRYQMSLSQLINLNQPIKTPEQLKDLRGQWVVVPVNDKDHQSAGDASSPREEKLRQLMSGFWQGVSQGNSGGDAALNQANSMIDAAATAEVESWLNHTAGHARVTLNSAVKRGENEVGLDYLHPLWSGQSDVIFTQFSGHRWNERNIANLGLGWRHLMNSDLMVGGNLFYDQDFTRHHNRLGSGLELWSQRLRATANYYLPLSGWQHSKDLHLTDAEYFDLYERAARGWDVNFNAALSDHIALNAGWFQWYGDKVDVKGSRSETSKNPHGLNLGLKWQPVPLLSFHTEQDFISNQSNDFKLGLDLNWQFGRTLSEMLDPARARAMPSLMQSNTAFVERNNNIVLDYKEQKKNWQIYFDPAELSVKAGSQPVAHLVKGNTAALTRYYSSNPSVAQVDSISGLMTPRQEGNATVTAETYVKLSDGAVSRASYQLKVLPGDNSPSVTDVAIDGSAQIGNTLTGHYRYQANGGAAEGATLQQWFWANDMNHSLTEGNSYTVTDNDIGKTLVYSVTPINISNIQGEAGRAEILGPTVRLASLIFEPLEGGIREDNVVKFPANKKGSILFTAKVLDAQGQAIADRMVWWHNSNDTLGKLASNQVRTDAKGLARVVFDDIESAGSDVVIASLSEPASSVAKDATDIEKTAAFDVTIAQPALELNAVGNPGSVVVGSGKLTLIAKLKEQDMLGVANQTLSWISDNQPVGTTITDLNGLSQTELNVPETLGSGKWQISVAQQGHDPVSLTLNLVLAAAPTELQSNPASVAETVGATGKSLSISGGNLTGAISFHSSDASVVTVNETSGAMTFLKVGNASITVSQAATPTQAAPANLSVPVTVSRQTAGPLVSDPASVQQAVGASGHSLSISGGNSSGAITFASSDTSVVTVNETSGAMTFLKVGTASITVRQAQTATQAAPANLSVPVTVSKQAAGPLVSDPASVQQAVGASGHSLSISGGNSSGAITFASTDTSVVTVGADSGAMTFLKVGTASITVSQAPTDTHNAPQNLSVPVTVTASVQAPPQPLESDPASFREAVGTTGKKLTITGGYETGAITFSSTDASVVTVNRNSGALTFLKVGTASIVVRQAQTDDHPALSLTVPVTVIVNLPAAPALIANPNPVTAMANGENITLDVTGGNSSGIKSFSSSDPTVVSVVAESGTMSFHKAGNANIIVRQTATATQAAPAELTVPVTVNRQTPPALVSNPASINTIVGKTGISLSISGGSGTGTIFTSTDSSIVSVTGEGALTFSNPGTATINVTQTQNDIYSAPQMLSVPVRVLATSPALIVTPAAVEVTWGSGKRPFQVSGGNGSALTFTSGDNAIVDVDSIGNMTFGIVGETTIKVSQAATATMAAPADVFVNVNVIKKDADPLTGSNISGQIGSGTTLNISGGIPDTAKSFVSSNTDIVTVNPTTGEVSYKAAGSAAITVSQSETANYNKPDSLTINVVVNPLSPLVLSSLDLGGSLSTANYRFTVTRDGQPVQGVRVCAVPKFPLPGGADVVFASGYTNANGQLTVTFNTSPDYNSAGFKGKLC